METEVEAGQVRFNAVTAAPLPADRMDRALENLPKLDLGGPGRVYSAAGLGPACVGVLVFLWVFSAFQILC